MSPLVTIIVCGPSCFALKKASQRFDFPFKKGPSRKWVLKCRRVLSRSWISTDPATADCSYLAFEWVALKGGWVREFRRWKRLNYFSPMGRFCNTGKNSLWNQTVKISQSRLTYITEAANQNQSGAFMFSFLNQPWPLFSSNLEKRTQHMATLSTWQQ